MQAIFFNLQKNLHSHKRSGNYSSETMDKRLYRDYIFWYSHMLLLC